MVDEGVKRRIREMLEEGYSYRQIRRELGVGCSTITKVKKEMDFEKQLEGVLRSFEEFFNSAEFIRLKRAWTREEAKLTDEKLESLWNYWNWLELEYITWPLIEWRKVKLSERILDLVFLSIYQIWLWMDQLFDLFTRNMFVVLGCTNCTGAPLNYIPYWGNRGYPPVVPFYRHYIIGR